MRALILSDIHGNVHALEAVLQAAQGWDELWNLGDAVGYGANPNEVLNLLREHATLHVRGNHDRACSGLTSTHGFNPVAAEAASWTKQKLTVANLEWIRAWPQGPIQATIKASCAHGSPIHEDQYIVTMRDAWGPLQKMETPITFFGHTHVQGGFSQHFQDWEEFRPRYATQNDAETWTIELPEGSRHLLNPGSVGQPRDNDWRAAFAIYDDTAGQLTFHRIPYDVAGAQKAIRGAGLPERLAARLETGR
ncbi:metallophosphoesterase family protein [Granulicella cerasi]|uniref:Metallophosphoesterase family protein n=1 Tax=Granulicella cerasi TaxID=741063 RepID=A0ABW1ZAC0_9BACT|nr:metallophosphoesterase family protein [Granulicella cerasi]